MDSQKQSAVDRIKQANNILVTVSANPTVDQLAACLGLTIMLNELGKHGTAVFSGAVPSTIEFLQPEKTLEKNTDSLRDFIISLDKAKADKLRYKVEDKVVKIFITPYRTSISDKDLEFSQGDFNVDVVIALGVHEQKDLDQAITSHGRILHDATIISVNNKAGNNLGTINWLDDKASSLCEMVASIAESFEKKVLDNQVATALLTGIVAETDRFSNDRTSPETMKVSSQLMAAGANQQLVASKLEEPPPPPPPPPLPPSDNHDDHADEKPTPPPKPPKPSDGTLRIEHNGGNPDETKDKESEKANKPSEDSDPKEPKDERPQIHIDEQGQLVQIGGEHDLLQGSGPDEDAGELPTADNEKPSGSPAPGSEFAFTPPTMGGTLTANTSPEALDPSTDPLSAPKLDGPLLQHNNQAPAATPLPPLPPVPVPTPPAPTVDLPPVTATNIPDFTLPPPGAVPAVPVPVPEPPKQPAPPADDDQTLTDIEKAIHSPHTLPPDAGNARVAVDDAVHAAPPGAPEPIAALNAQPLGGNLHDSGDDASAQGPTPDVGGLAEPLSAEEEKEPAPASASPSDKPMDMPLPPTLMPPPAVPLPPTPQSNNNPSAPPPVPPPMMPLPPAGQ